MFPHVCSHALCAHNLIRECFGYCLLTNELQKSQSRAGNFITFLETDGIVHKISDVQ